MAEETRTDEGVGPRWWHWVLLALGALTLGGIVVGIASYDGGCLAMDADGRSYPCSLAEYLVIWIFLLLLLCASPIGLVVAAIIALSVLIAIYIHNIKNRRKEDLDGE